MSKIINIVYVKSIQTLSNGAKVEMHGVHLADLETHRLESDTACLSLYDINSPGAVPVFMIPISRLCKVEIREMTEQEEKIFNSCGLDEEEPEPLCKTCEVARICTFRSDIVTDCGFYKSKKFIF